MQRYNSRRHRKMMDESEYALRQACDSSSNRVSRIVNTIVGDSQKYRHWESNHAELLLPVAQQNNKKRQILALRKIEVQLVHRRALFNLIREQHVRGKAREKLFRLFRATRDYQDAVIAEHQQYMIAMSSRVSTDHLIDVMHDVDSKRLIEEYEESYANYFKMKCYLAITEESYFVELVQLTLRDAREELRKKRERIETELPKTEGSSFDREAVLAQSGRYPILNYMVG
jgi:hypothetical protein